VIDALKEAYSVSQLCKVMAVPRSSYYASHHRRGRIRIDPATLAQVQRAHEASRFSYGSRRMARELSSLGTPVGRYRARTLMRAAGVWAHKKRRHRYRPEGPSAAIVPNHLDRQFQPAAPNRVWAGDVTYLPTRQGWLYLAIVVDLYARKVVGAAFSNLPDAALIVRALDQAWHARRPGPGVLFHSDQGSTYASERFRMALNSHAMVQSMSRRGNCWDNAVVERFFRSLKQEWIDGMIYRDHEQAERDVTAYLSFYNHRRWHAAIGQRVPGVVDALAGKHPVGVSKVT
jgi:putative transposase